MNVIECPCGCRLHPSAEYEEVSVWGIKKKVRSHTITRSEACEEYRSKRDALIPQASARAKELIGENTHMFGRVFLREMVNLARETGLR